jgi:maltose 6'-phosphate phosphatase
MHRFRQYSQAPLKLHRSHECDQCVLAGILIGFCIISISQGEQQKFKNIRDVSGNKHLKLMFRHGLKNMRRKIKLPLNSYNRSNFFYIIVIILPLILLVYCAAAQNSEAMAAGGIKVMTINLLFSEIDDRNKRLKIIADYVAENDVDFVLLQEVVRGDLAKTDNSAKDLRNFIFRRHNLEYFLRTETETITIPIISDFLRVGNGILSRHKIEYSDDKDLPKAPEIEIFDIFEIELRRNVLMIRAIVNGYGAIHVYITHLCAGCKTKEREEQLDALLHYVKKKERNITGENPVLLGGDFNIDRFKQAGVEAYLYEKVLWEGFIDAYAAATIDPLDELCEDKNNPDEHCTIGVTDLGDSNPGRIDYIFAKDFRKVTNSQVIFNSAITDDPTVSDHSAVSVSLVGNKLKPIPLPGAYLLILNDVEDNY